MATQIPVSATRHTKIHVKVTLGITFSDAVTLTFEPYTCTSKINRLGALSPAMFENTLRDWVVSTPAKSTSIFHYNAWAECLPHFDVVDSPERAIERDGWLNPLHAKFFRGNINIYMYLHFMSLLHIYLTQVLKTLPRIREGPTYSI